MERIAELLEGIRERLEEQLPGLAHVGPDRGQLAGHGVPPGWPCALLDVKRIDYTTGVGGRRMADVRIIVTVADAAGEEREAGGRAIDLAGGVCGALDSFSVEGCGPLCCTELRRIEVDGAGECYRLTWRTAFEIDYGRGYDSVRISQVKLEL